MCACVWYIKLHLSIRRWERLFEFMCIFIFTFIHSRGFNVYRQNNLYLSGQAICQNSWYWAKCLVVFIQTFYVPSSKYTEVDFTFHCIGVIKKKYQSNMVNQLNPKDVELVSLRNLFQVFVFRVQIAFYYTLGGRLNITIRYFEYFQQSPLDCQTL